MLKFQDLLKKIKTNEIQNPKPKFVKMVKDYQMEKFPDHIFLYMASDSISPTTISYINCIYNNALDEKKYKELTFDMLEEYKDYHEFLKDIRNAHPKLLKDSLENYNDFYTLLTKLNELNLSDKIKYGVNFFMEFAKPYENIKQDLDWAKNRLGVIFHNKIFDFNDIQPFNNTNYALI